MEINKNLLYIFFFVLCFLLGILSGYLIWSGNSKTEFQASYREVRDDRYTFINPLLDCEFVNETSWDKNLQILKKDVQELIRKRKVEKDVTHVSVYYRDLNNGPWFGINEKEKFSPASLLKVFVLVAFLSEAQQNPTFLDEKLVLEKDSSENEQIFPVKQPLKEGEEYTIEELLEYLIHFSDNDAAYTLLKNRKDSWADLDTLLNSLDIVMPEEYIEDYMSVKEYSGIFRVLYNSSFLNKDMSEKALELLSRTGFNKGISGNIDSDVIVSNKFGERTLPNSNKMQTSKFQLHDCGIVYEPSKPYLICIMTRGHNVDSMLDTIAEISGVIYSHVKRN